MKKNENSLNVRATGVIGLAVLLSRFLGLIREVLFNSFFGTSSMGVFLIAFRAPNLLRDLFAEGALSISFITVFSQKIATEGEESAWALASKVMTLTIVVMSVISVLGVIYAKQMIAVLAPGFAPADAQMTVYLTQIMYPFILLVSLAALTMGMLNSRNVFGVPALASSFFNLGSIAGGMLCGWLLDPHFGVRALTGLAIGTLIGGVLQLISQFPSLKRVGFRFKPDFRWNDPGVREVLILTVPAIIAASAVQINVLINTSFASYLGKEAVTWLNSAFRLMQFPIGIFGVAVATITLPVVSRIATTNDHGLFGATLGRALRLAVFLTMPAAVGLYFFAYPIIGVIYQHWKFQATDTLQTALALQFYAPGLMAYSCIKVLSPGFYAIRRKWVPMIVSLGAVLLNVVLNYTLIFKAGLGHKGLAFSTTICATVNFVILYLLMAATHDLQTRRFLDHVFRCLVACFCLGAFSWFILTTFHDQFYIASLWVRLAALAFAVPCCGIIYLLICLLLKVEGTKEIFNRRQWRLAAKTE